MRIHLPYSLQKSMDMLPESGMGYQEVNVRLRNGRVIGGAFVFNGQELEIPDSAGDINVEDVVELSLADKGNDDFMEDLAGSMDLDPGILYEGGNEAAKALEKRYNERIRMAETRAKLAEKEVDDIKDLFKKTSEQLKTYSEALERDEKSFDSVAEVFSGLGYPKYQTQCKEKASHIRDLLARHRTFLAHIKTLMDTI